MRWGFNGLFSSTKTYTIISSKSTIFENHHTRPPKHCLRALTFIMVVKSNVQCSNHQKQKQTLWSLICLSNNLFPKKHFFQTSGRSAETSVYVRCLQ